jgi:hypothetical protein
VWVNIAHGIFGELRSPTRPMRCALLPKLSEPPQFGPILRACIQGVKKESKRWWMSVSESPTNREVLHSWTQARL